MYALSRHSSRSLIYIFKHKVAQVSYNIFHILISLVINSLLYFTIILLFLFMTIETNNHCNKCRVRVPKNHPKLKCIICNENKHFKCQSLSKADAKHISESSIDWICTGCITSILPINACTINRSKQSLKKIQSSVFMLQWLFIFVK